MGFFLSEWFVMPNNATIGFISTIENKMTLKVKGQCNSANALKIMISTCHF